MRPDWRRSKYREKQKRVLLIQWSMVNSREHVLIKLADLKRGNWEVHELENVFQLDYRHAEKAAKGKMINTKLRTRPN